MRAVINPYLPVRPLFDAPLILSDGTSVRFESTNAVGGNAAAAARMLRPVLGLDFEIGEMPIVNYLSARDMGLDLSALPVFLTRRFVHRLTFCRAAGPVTDPAQLAGRRVGLGYWGHSDSTWARALLAADYGLDLDRITWVTSEEEQVPGAVLPPNVVHVPHLDLDQMLRSGELDAVIFPHGKTLDLPDNGPVTPVIRNWEKAERCWFTQTGIFPVLHVVVIRDRVLQEHPGLASELLAAFTRAKATALERHGGGTPLTGDDLRCALKSGFPVPELAHLGPDPMPYGLEANRAGLEMLSEAAAAQHILSAVPSIDDIILSCD
jgi:4,5-dihydroxyphthalate decarboxylase